MPHKVAYERWKAMETSYSRNDIGYKEIYPSLAPLAIGNDLLLLGILLH
jgi:hypothetical protein